MNIRRGKNLAFVHERQCYEFGFMRFKLPNLLALLLMIGLVLPACSKAFAQTAASDDEAAFSLARESDAKVTLKTSDELEKNRLGSPCLSCCGGWQVTLVYVAPLPRPSDKVAILTKTPGFCAHCPPYENSLNNERAPPNIAPKFHGYSMMRARTGRLLL